MAASALVELPGKNSAIIKTSEHENRQESWQVSTWDQCASLASGCAALLICLAKSLLLAARASTWLELMFSALIGYMAADLVSGIYHWAIDNYGSAETPVFGSQIEAFQGHHQQPWAITTRQVASNLHILAVGTTIAVFPLSVLSNDAVLLGFVGVFAGCEMFSQQFHAWAHTPKRKLPAVVVALQDVGILVGRAQHVAHHRPPYNSNYCIVSGMWNIFLDKSKFFVALEVVLLHLVGVKPRSWSDPNSDWTQL